MGQRVEVVREPLPVLGADLAQVAVAVLLEHAGEGSKKAAPLFRQVVEAYFARQSDVPSSTG